MSFILNGDNLKRQNGTSFNVFNQNSKIEKLKASYKKILKTNIGRFLKKATDDMVDKHDVLRYLEKQGLTNDRITSNSNYKSIVDKALNDKKNELVLGGNNKKRRYRKSKNDPSDINGKALAFLLNNIVLPHDKKINDSDIIKPLINNNIIKNKSELSHKFLRRMRQQCNYVYKRK